MSKTRKTSKPKAKAERVKKSEQVLATRKATIELINTHDKRALTSHERLYDNEIIRNSLGALKSKALDISQLSLNVKMKNNHINKAITAKLISKAKIRKGDVVTFASRNSDTKTGDIAKLITFVTSNRLSALKGIECADTFVFYVR